MKGQIKKTVTKLIIIVSVLLIVGCNANPESTVSLKYEGDIDVSTFDYISTTKSSFIDGAWYDSNTEDLILKLNNDYYKYCYVPSSTWQEFKNADSFGSYFNKSIKEDYPCN